MNINFPLMLVVLTAAAGVIWLIDSRFSDQPGLRATRGGWCAQIDGRCSGCRGPGSALAGRSVSLFFPILVVVLLLRSFLVEPFQIPSGSMLPTLEVGDFILVNKFAYGLRLPVVHYEFLSVDDPERGDIMVFRYPVEPSINYIKRVVGTPGDRVRYEDKQLYINGERVETDFVARLANEDLLRERLDGTRHRLFYSHGRNDPRAEGEWVVPEHHYFVMGRQSRQQPRQPLLGHGSGRPCGGRGLCHMDALGIPDEPAELWSGRLD